MSSVRNLVERATAELQTAGCPSAKTDAEILLSHVLKIERNNLASIEKITPDQLVIFLGLIGKRAKRIPLQHLTGIAYFRYLQLKVGSGVFIPRPETELLVQAGLDELNKIDRPKLAVDLCAGSGAVALSLALESPNTTVHAVEVSAEAFSWLEQNVSNYAQQLNRVNSNVITYLADATDENVLSKLNGMTDVVLSNPPYIPDDMIPREPEVLNFDPKIALFGGSDGFDVARGIGFVAANLLKPFGFFAMEHADVQGESVVELLNSQSDNHLHFWQEVEDHLDYNNLPRFVTAVRKPQVVGESI